MKTITLNAVGAPAPEDVAPSGEGAKPELISIHLKNILVPLDFSELSLKSLQYAVPFAKQFGARLTLLHVLMPPVYPSDFPVPPCPEPGADCFEALKRQLADIRAAKIPPELPVEIVVLRSFALDGILEVARETCADLIIATTHGRTGLKHMLLGSTAESIIRRAPCPVLIVREREHDFV